MNWTYIQEIAPDALKEAEGELNVQDRLEHHAFGRIKNRRDLFEFFDRRDIYVHPNRVTNEGHWRTRIVDDKTGRIFFTRGEAGRVESEIEGLTRSFQLYQARLRKGTTEQTEVTC